MRNVRKNQAIISKKHIKRRKKFYKNKIKENKQKYVILI